MFFFSMIYRGRTLTPRINCDLNQLHRVGVDRLTYSHAVRELAGLPLLFTAKKKNALLKEGVFSVLNVSRSVY